MKKLVLAVLLLAGCSRTIPVTAPPPAPAIDIPFPVGILDNQVTDPDDCVYDNGTYYNVTGFMVDGVLATSEVSCDDTYFKWLKMPAMDIKLLKA